MKKIVFEGGLDLQVMYPEGIEVEGDSAYECIYALRNFPGFEIGSGRSYVVETPDFQSRDALKDRTNHQIIRLVQVVGGAGGKAGSIVQMVVGVILIASGVGSPLGFTVFGTFVSASTVISVGVLMVAQGVIGLLMPAPEISKQGNDEKSNYLPSNKNTVKIGTRIPIPYGRNKLYGHFLSFNVSSTNLNDPAPPDTVPSGGSTVVGGNVPPGDYGGGSHWEYDYYPPEDGGSVGGA